MKRLYALIVAVLIPVSTWAGLRTVSFYISPVATNAVASTDSQTGISGRVVAYDIDVTTTAAVAIATSAGTGSSISGAKTIKTSAAVVGGTSAILTNSALTKSGPYLWTDTVTVSATGAVGTVETVKVILFLED